MTVLLTFFLSGINPKQEQVLKQVWILLLIGIS